MAKTSIDKKYIRDTIENVQTNEITISEDKLRNKLEKQIKRIKKSSGVISYLSVAITCVGVLVSTDFKEVYGITPDMWKTVFFLAAIVFIILFLTSGFNALFNKATVDSIIKDIKTADILDNDVGIWCWIKNLFSSNNNDFEAEEEKEK